MTSTKCPKCGTDMDPKKPCPDCGHEIGAPKESEDGIKPPKIKEEDLSKPTCDKCGKKHTADMGCKAKADSVDRIDYWGDLNGQATMSEALESTGNGALVGKAAIFGVGVYRYMGADGKVTAEFRPPEEVITRRAFSRQPCAGLLRMCTAFRTSSISRRSCRSCRIRIIQREPNL